MTALAAHNEADMPCRCLVELFIKVTCLYFFIRKQKKNVVRREGYYRSKMDRSVRDKGNEEGVVLKRPGIHDERPRGTYLQDENNYRLGYIDSSNSPSRKKEGNGIVFRQLFSGHLFVVVTVLVIILGVGVELQFPPLAAEERGYRQFNASLTNLQKTFPNQTEQLWHVSLAAVKPVLLQKLPKHPAVIFLAGPKRTEAVTDCLARKISELTNDAFEVEIPVSVFDCRMYKDWGADKVKQEITEKLTTTFGNGSKVAVILAVESLPGDSPTVFNRFCDTAYAPFKKVALILTLNTKHESASEVKEEHRDPTKLREPVAEKDKTEMLLSQFRKSVAYVRDEENQLNCVAEK